jgi:hypothetical protein
LSRRAVDVQRQRQIAVQKTDRHLAALNFHAQVTTRWLAFDVYGTPR